MFLNNGMHIVTLLSICDITYKMHGDTQAGSLKLSFMLVVNYLDLRVVLRINSFLSTRKLGVRSLYITMHFRYSIQDVKYQMIPIA